MCVHIDDNVHTSSRQAPATPGARVRRDAGHRAVPSQAVGETEVLPAPRGHVMLPAGPWELRSAGAGIGVSQCCSLVDPGRQLLPSRSLSNPPWFSGLKALGGFRRSPPRLGRWRPHTHLCHDWAPAHAFVGRPLGQMPALGRPAAIDRGHPRPIETRCRAARKAHREIRRVRRCHVQGRSASCTR